MGWQHSANTATFRYDDPEDPARSGLLVMSNCVPIPCASDPDDDTGLPWKCFEADSVAFIPKLSSTKAGIGSASETIGERRESDILSNLEVPPTETQVDKPLHKVARSSKKAWPSSFKLRND